MTLYRRIVDQVTIDPEREPVIITNDGKIQTATAEEAVNEDSRLITAERDMLPVAYDSPMRTWGFFSMAGYWIAE